MIDLARCVLRFAVLNMLKNCRNFRKDCIFQVFQSNLIINKIEKTQYALVWFIFKIVFQMFERDFRIACATYLLPRRLKINLRYLSFVHISCFSDIFLPCRVTRLFCQNLIVWSVVLSKNINIYKYSNSINLINNTILILKLTIYCWIFQFFFFRVAITINFYSIIKALQNFTSNFGSVNFQLFQFLISLTNFLTFTTNFKMNFISILKMLRPVI